jgi:hypothetical protein
VNEEHEAKNLSKLLKMCLSDFELRLLLVICKTEKCGFIFTFSPNFDQLQLATLTIILLADRERRGTRVLCWEGDSGDEAATSKFPEEIKKTVLCGTH